MSFEDEFGDWAVHPVSVEKHEGEGAWGEIWADPETIECWYEHGNHVVTTQDGRQIVADTRVVADMQYAHLLNYGARVTIPGDPRVYRVQRVKSYPLGDEGHVEANLS